MTSESSGFSLIDTQAVNLTLPTDNHIVGDIGHTVDHNTIVKAIKSLNTGKLDANDPTVTNSVNHIAATKTVHGITDTSDLVYKSTTGTITGVKTFTQPVTVATPTEDTHAATKKTVSDKIAAKIHAGRASIALTADAAGTATVTWPARTGTLSVTATVYGTIAYIATVENLTSTGCTIRIQHKDNTTATVTLSVHYIVVSA